VITALSAFAGLINNSLDMAILTMGMLIAFSSAERSSLSSVILVTGVAFQTMPYLGLYCVNQGTIGLSFFGRVL